MQNGVKVSSASYFYRVLAIAVRALFVLALAAAGWVVYQTLPASRLSGNANVAGRTSVQIVLRRSSDLQATAIDIPIEMSPVDLVAVRHEFFVEPRPGQRFAEFLRQRMNGRSAVNTRLDSEGRALVSLPQGNWWLHAVLAGEEDLEWRLPVMISGQLQTIELTTQNAYTRSKNF
jgi:hypothetical protein